MIHSMIKGSGENIVLLHGWGCSMRQMLPIMDELVSDYRVACLDLFGFGESEDCLNYEKFSDYVDCFHDFIVSNQLDNPILIAHSFGARVAFLYAAQYPVKALVVCGAAGLKSPLSLKKRMMQFLRRHHLIQYEGSVDYQQASPFLKKVLVEVVNTDLSNVIASLSVPSLIVGGKEDSETPYWMAKRMHLLLEESILLTLKGGHFAYLHEKSQFVAMVKMFLRSELCE